MVKRILLTIAFMASVPAFGANILGTWQTVHSTNGFTLTMTLGIEQNVTHLTNVCEYAGQRAEVAADVPSKIEGNTYSFTGTVQKTTSAGGINCNIDAKPITLNYQVTDTQLVLSAGGEALVFNRVR